MNKKLYDLIESTVKNGSVSDKQRRFILDKALWLDEDVDEVENILDEKLKLSLSNFNKDAEGVYLKQSENNKTGSNPQSNEELQSLIDLAIADGMITDNERKVVLKKAVSLGFDQDEVEMILDGKLALFLNQKNENQPIKKNVKEGEIDKCPACGAFVKALETKCLDCDYEFRNTKVSNAIERLFQLLSNVDLSTNRKSSNKVPWYSLNNQNKDKISNVDEKCQIIENFPIPNTKEDIIEFLTRSLPSAQRVKKGRKALWVSESWAGADDSGVLEQKINKAWANKCEQIILKARVIFKNNSSFLIEINSFADQLGMKKK